MIPRPTDFTLSLHYAFQGKLVNSYFILIRLLRMTASSALIFHKRLIRIIAQSVAHKKRFPPSGALANTSLNQLTLKKSNSPAESFCDIAAALCQHDSLLAGDHKISSALQLADHIVNTRLRKIHPLCDVNRANASLFFDNLKNCVQIILHGIRHRSRSFRFFGTSVIHFSFHSSSPSGP